MFIKVAKFGGTSMADSAAFKKTAEIIMADASRRYIVVSAPGKRGAGDDKITDLLYRCYDEMESDGNFHSSFDKIRERFNEIVSGLNLELDINSKLNKIEDDIKSFATRDYAASRGEYLAALILAKYLNFDFIDAADIVKFRSDGLLDSEYTNDITAARLSNCVKGAVIPGFYGRLAGGGIKTFSRGGSDVTGSIVARAMNVTLYENWTDVDGFLTCDPKIVDNPLLIEELSYSELRELSYMGAEVLHPESIFPVRRSAIPINIKNTFNPSAKGTMIVPQISSDNTRTVTGIAGKKGFLCIYIEKSMMNNEVGFARKILSVFEHHHISVEHMPSGIDILSFIVDASALPDQTLVYVLDEITGAVNPDRITVERDMAMIATVGHGMTRKKGVAYRLFDALTRADINVRMIDQGSSELNLILGVEGKDFKNAINAIYNEFLKE